MAQAVTVVCPVDPARLAELQECIARLPTGGASPLARTGTTHFGRWVVIDQMHDEDGDARSDELSCPYLLFTSNLDGPISVYLADLVAESSEALHELWGHCVGYPNGGGDQALVAYLTKNRIPTNLFFIGYPTATVADVARALDLRRDFIDFAVRSQGLPSAALAARFRAEFAHLAATGQPAG